MQKGLINMVAVTRTLDRIIETSSKTPSRQEAQKVLRSCGILDNQNNIKPAYKKIITGGSSRKHGSK